MIRIVYAPQWFYGIDTIIESFSFLTALLIAYYAYKFYKFSFERKYKYFSLSFLALALGSLAKIAMNFTVYYPYIIKEQIGALNIDITGINKAMFYVIGFDAHRILMLFGLAGIYILLSKSKLKSQLILFTYFILLAALFSNNSYFIFYITMALFLGYIVFFYYKNYTLNPKNNKLILVALAFFMIFIAQLCFLTIFCWEHLYAIGGFFQLVGYLMLLYSYVSLVLPTRK